MASDVVRGRDEEWIIIVGPGPIDATKAQLAEWRHAHPDVVDEDLRNDLIHTTGADELRVLVRRTPT